MKRLFYLSFILLFFSSCEKTKISDPQIISFTVDDPDLYPYDSITKSAKTVLSQTHFTVFCNADQAVIWFGDKYYGDPNNGNKISDYDSLQTIIAHPNTVKNVTFNYPEGKALTADQMSGTATIDYTYTDSLNAKVYNKYKNGDKIKAILIVSNVGDLGKVIKTKQQEIILTIHKP